MKQSRRQPCQFRCSRRNGRRPGSSPFPRKGESETPRRERAGGSRRPGNQEPEWRDRGWRSCDRETVDRVIAPLRPLNLLEPTLALVLIGDGPLAGALSKQAEGLANVSFLGWRPNADVRAWMGGATAVSRQHFLIVPRPSRVSARLTRRGLQCPTQLLYLVHCQHIARLRASRYGGQARGTE